MFARFANRGIARHKKRISIAFQAMLILLYDTVLYGLFIEGSAFFQRKTRRRILQPKI